MLKRRVLCVRPYPLVVFIQSFGPIYLVNGESAKGKGVDRIGRQAVNLRRGGGEGEGFPFSSPPPTRPRLPLRPTHWFPKVVARINFLSKTPALQVIHAKETGVKHRADGPLGSITNSTYLPFWTHPLYNL